MRPGMIEVTGVSLEALVRAAYNPSRPQGLGMIHYQPGDLTDDEVKSIIRKPDDPDYSMPVTMDYVKGRSCKFTVQRKDGRLFINNSWYDHSDSQLRELLEGVGLSPDLVDKARAEEDAYTRECMSEALTYLAARDGSFVEKSGSRVSDMVSHGLYSAQSKGLVKREWVGESSDTKWSLAKALA